MVPRASKEAGHTVLLYEGFLNLCHSCLCLLLGALYHQTSGHQVTLTSSRTGQAALTVLASLALGKGCMMLDTLLGPETGVRSSNLAQEQTLVWD